MKKAIFFITILIVIVVIAVFTWQYHNDEPKRITFAECEKIGGIVWLTNPYHPDLCSSCSDYYQCYNKYGDIGIYCQEQIGPEWSKNELYRKCVDDIFAELEKDCPEISTQCATCASSKLTKSMYLDECPNGMKKIAEISNSATWHQCCK